MVTFHLFSFHLFSEKVAVDKGVLRGARISDGWWHQFMKRHPNLSLRSGDSTGYARMNAMNEENLKVYFDLLDTVLEENNLKARYITWTSQGCL